MPKRKQTEEVVARPNQVDVAGKDRSYSNEDFADRGPAATDVARVGRRIDHIERRVESTVGPAQKRIVSPCSRPTSGERGSTRDACATGSE